ncbi:hypothetical protein BU25DRAFT_122863 [Macroventuria anomochaeta]|uniref:Uncharacterized protein n=1 Tax=Macroventuria anomochaeta TaxID=301207 RepID=A0ACB6RSY7_9PLEO|nr:uncharacterized protein BU25DRAFT_122863 [Macroventuria anomochaeta]KAF2625100.1 hypothetical protein BU25DRAFT_122863 [Macroventuria anomochaeta]
MKVLWSSGVTSSQPIPKKTDRNLSCLADVAEQTRGHVMDIILQPCEIMKELREYRGLMYASNRLERLLGGCCVSSMGLRGCAGRPE